MWYALMLHRLDATKQRTNSFGINRLRRIKFQSEKAGLHLNLGKTKVMNTAGVKVSMLGNDNIEIVRSFKFLGAVITDV